LTARFSREPGPLPQVVVMTVALSTYEALLDHAACDAQSQVLA